MERISKRSDRVRALELVFASPKLAKICSTEARMVRAFGPELGRRVRTRLTELDQSASLAEIRRLPHARAHQLVADRDEQISLDLIHPRRLIIAINDNPIPRLRDGGLDWEAVISVRILEVTDTHA